MILGRARIWAVLACLTLALVACGRRDTVPVPDLPPPPASTAAPTPDALSHPDWHIALIAGIEKLNTGQALLDPLADQLRAAGIPPDHVQPFTGAKASGRERADAAREDSRARRHGPDADAGQPPDAPPQTDIPQRTGGGRQPGDPISASPGSVLRHLLTLAGRRGRESLNAACFVYLGGAFDGDDVALPGGTVSASDLDRALGGGCGAAPTVVVASGCGSGVLARPPFARDNRIVIAASDKEGFGCGPNLGLTTFEECFLGALDGAARWIDLAQRVTLCVTRREELVNQPAIPPVVSVGRDVTGLPTPWASLWPGTKKVDFRPGIGRFAADDAPYYSVLKTRTHPAFEAYARAAKPKAMALTLAGTVEWVSAQLGESAEDVARLALERCEFVSAGACQLYARDDIVAAPEFNGQISPQPRGVRAADHVDPASVPFVRDDQRRAISAYATLPAPKALALGPMTEAFAIGTGTAQDAADAVAIGRCGTDCVLYARGETVVLR